MADDQFTRYFKFAFVRNPWDRVVSLYRYSSLNVPFKNFVLRRLATTLWERQYWFVRPQREFIVDNAGSVRTDFVGRYECLDAHFRHVRREVGLEARLPHANASVETGGGLGSRCRDLTAGIIRCDATRLRSALGSSESHAEYHRYYDDATKKAVERLYEQDIDEFRYTF